MKGYELRLGQLRGHHRRRAGCPRSQGVAHHRHRRVRRSGRHRSDLLRQRVLPGARQGGQALCPAGPGDGGVGQDRRGPLRHAVQAVPGRGASQGRQAPAVHDGVRRRDPTAGGDPGSGRPRRGGAVGQGAGDGAPAGRLVGRPVRAREVPRHLPRSRAGADRPQGLGRRDGGHAAVRRRAGQGDRPDGRSGGLGGRGQAGPGAPSDRAGVRSRGRPRRSRPTPEVKKTTAKRASAKKAAARKAPAKKSAAKKTAAAKKASGASVTRIRKSA